MDTLIAVHAIDRVLEPGVAGDKNKGISPKAPRVQRIKPGQYFQAKDTTEQDDLVGRGAARIVPKKETEAKVILSANIDEANEQAALAAEQARKEAEERTRLAAEQQARDNAKLEQERNDEALKKSKEEAERVAAEKKAAAEKRDAEKKAAERKAATEAKKTAPASKKSDEDANDLV